MAVNKEAFNRYRRVQMAGVVNMFDRDTVCELALLTREEYLYILKHYSELAEEYGEYEEEAYGDL